MQTVRKFMFMGALTLFLASFLAFSPSSSLANEKTMPPLPQTVVIRPEATEGKDAVFSSLVPHNNYATLPDIHLRSWTQADTINTNRVALDFTKLNSLPNGSITQATLSLYFNNTSGYGSEHYGETSLLYLSHY